MNFPRTSLVAVIPVLALIAGCSPDEAATSATSATSTEEQEVTAPKSTECIVDVLSVDSGYTAEIASALGPSYRKGAGEFGGGVEIPGVLFAGLSVPGKDYGVWSFTTIVGLSYYSEEELGADGATVSRRVATLEAQPVHDPALAFANRRYAAAKALFHAMTEAEETREAHAGNPTTGDQRIVRVTRTSRGGRLSCASSVYPDSTEPGAYYLCTFKDVQGNHVDSYNTKDTKGTCLGK